MVQRQNRQFRISKPMTIFSNLCLDLPEPTFTYIMFKEMQAFKTTKITVQ